MPEEQKDKNEKLEQCEKERDEYLNGWKRAKADLINYQKEEAKRFEEVVKFSNAALVKELISVLDSFGLALSVLEKESNSTSAPQIKGIYMIQGQLEDIMKKSGLEKMATAVGNKFDPAMHEAVGELESNRSAGTVIEEVSGGYLLSGRVIRPAHVKIAKSKIHTP